MRCRTINIGWRMVSCLAAGFLAPLPLNAQDAAAPAAEVAAAAPAAAAPAGLSEAELRELVAPIALYPDELVAIILPAATLPLQLVEADRYLDDVAADPNVQPNPEWDPSVVALLNYPDVIDTLNADLGWTQDLGDAVVDQQDDVIAAIQLIRSETYDAGYLQSTEQVAVEEQGTTIVIQSADPEVVYVPTYDPAPIVNNTYVSAPPPVYSQPYPYYSSPVAPFFTGMFFGTALGFAMDWDDDDGGGDHFDYDRDVDIETGDINIDNSRINADTRERFQNNQRDRDRTGQGNGWQPDRGARDRAPSAAQRDRIRQNTAHGLAPAGGRDRQGAQGNRGRQGQAGTRPGDQRGGGGGLGNPNGGRQQADRERSRGDRSVAESERGRGSQSARASQGSRQSAQGGSRSRQSAQGGSRSRQSAQGGSRGQSMGGSSSRSRSSAHSSRGRQSSGGGGRSSRGGGGGGRGGGRGR
jgi:hypothetical protein